MLVVVVGGVCAQAKWRTDVDEGTDWDSDCGAGAGVCKTDQTNVMVLDKASSIQGQVFCTDLDPSKQANVGAHYAAEWPHWARGSERRDTAMCTSTEEGPLQVDKEVEATCFANEQILFDALRFYCLSA